MKILALSDIHENIEIMTKIFSSFDFDLVFLLGDISELRIKDLYSVLKNLNREVVIITGNHDCVKCIELISRKLSNVHYKLRGVLELEVEGEELRLALFSGIYKKSNADGIFYFDDRFFLKFVRTVADFGSIDFFLSHVPPYHRADFLPKGGRGGLKAFVLCEDLCAPKFWVSGHTHVLAAENVNDHIYINCGLGYFGDLVLINTLHRNMFVGRFIATNDLVFSVDDDASWDFIYYLRRTRSFRRLRREILAKI